MTDAMALPDDARARILNAAIAGYSSKGWTVQTASAGQAVLSRNKRMGWFWNLVLVIITGGLWLIYVIYRALNRKKQTIVVTVDQFGTVHTSSV
jgi:hypothetical protein